MITCTINHVYLIHLFNYWVLEVREIYKNINRCNKHDFRRVCKVYLLDQNLRLHMKMNLKIMNVLKVNCKLDKTPSKQRNGC